MKKQHILTLVAATALTTSCAIPAAMVVGGAAGGGYMALQEKGFKAAAFDAKLKTHIKDRLTKLSYKHFTGIGVSVMEGEVLLTGVVDSQPLRAEAVNAVRGIQGVQLVYDELKVAEYTTAERAQDTWIATQIRGRLASARDVFGINYVLEVVQSEVYIFGLAGSTAELERALHLARTTKGVTKVHNYIKIAPEARELPGTPPASLPDDPQ